MFTPSWRVVILEALVAAAFFFYSHWIIGGLITLGAINGAYRRTVLGRKNANPFRDGTLSDEDVAAIARYLKDGPR